MRKMLALFGLFGLILMGLEVAAAGRADGSMLQTFSSDTLTPLQMWERVLMNDKVVPAACCKVCSTGKACGNSCISQSRTCSKPNGCACNG